MWLLVGVLRMMGAKWAIPMDRDPCYDGVCEVWCWTCGVRGLIILGLFLIINRWSIDNGGIFEELGKAAIR